MNDIVPGPSGRSRTPSNSSSNDLLISLDSDIETESSSIHNFTEPNSLSEEYEHDSALIKLKPNYNWSLIHEIMFREYGLSGTGRKSVIGNGALAFQNRFYGARHTVEKMWLSQNLKKHEGWLNCLNFNKAGNLLVSGSSDSKIIVWDWASNKIAYKFSCGHNSGLLQTKFMESEDGLRIISSSQDGQVRHAMLPPSGGTKIVSRLLFERACAVYEIALSPQNPYEILSVGHDGHVVRCDLRDNHSDEILIVENKTIEVPLYSIAHHPFDQEFCVGGNDQFVRVYDKRNTKGTLHIMFPQHLLNSSYTLEGTVTSAIYNSTGTEILASYSHEDIYLFNKCYLPGRFTHRFRGHKNRNTLMGVNFFGPNSEYIVSGSECGNLFFWDKSAESIVNWIKGDYRRFSNCLESHPSLPILAAAGFDDKIKILMPSNMNIPPKMKGLAECIKHNLSRPATFEAFIKRRNDFLMSRIITLEQYAAEYFRSFQSSSEEEDELVPDNNIHLEN